jgi:hypothetical protein
MKKTFTFPLIGADPIEVEAWLPSPHSFLDRAIEASLTTES